MSWQTMISRKTLLRALALAPTGLMLLLLAACDPSRPQSTFQPEGEIARDQLGLFWVIFWLAVGVFIVVEGVLVYSIFRFRKKPGETGFPPQTHGNTRLEIGWTLVPFFLLIIIAIPTYMTINAHAEPPEGEEVLQVTVVGHQWWWEFRYPELGVVTANELHVPRNHVVNLTLLSDDVIHSFWVPRLFGKTDVVPNSPNTMWFRANETGNYWGQCAELCGVAHAQMRFRLISQEPAEFDQWVAGQKTAPVGPQTDLERQGQQAFGALGCLACHSINVTTPEQAQDLQDSRMDGFVNGADVFAAPNLSHLAERTTIAAGLIPNTPENLFQWVKDPHEVKPGNRMGELAAAYQGGQEPSDEQVAAIVAYLQTLKAPPAGQAQQ